MVGDRCSDIGAANAAGLRKIFLLRGTENEPCTGAYEPVSALAEVEAWLLADEHKVSEQAHLGER